MTEQLNCRVPADRIASTRVRCFPASGDRQCLLSIATGAGGDRMTIETFDRDGIKLCGTLTLDASHVPELLAGVAEAARSLGFEITAVRTPPLGSPRAL